MAKNIANFTIIALAGVLAIGQADEFSNPQARLDHDFGVSRTPYDFLTSIWSSCFFKDLFQPWKLMAALSRDIQRSILFRREVDNELFQVKWDVQHFNPKDIIVKASDEYVMINAKHVERHDKHGFVLRRFVRKVHLPEGTDADNMISELSTDGVLTVTAPRKVNRKEERIVPITITAPARKEIKEEKL